MKRLFSLILVCALLMTGAALPARAEEQVIKVSSVDELLAALQPGVIIELEPKDYFLADAADYGQADTSGYYTWSDCYDGYELSLTYIDDLTVRAPQGARILSSSLYANVLAFRNCTGITLDGIVCGHAPEKGSCCGGVIWTEYCSDMKFYNCTFFGCGVTALFGYDSNTLVLKDCSLTDCSYSGAELCRCSDVLFDGCTFSLNGVGEEYTGAALFTQESVYVSLLNCSFEENALSYMVQCSASSDIALLGCRSSANTFNAFFYLEAANVNVTNCAFSDLNAGNAFAAAYNPGRVLAADGTELSVDALLLMRHAPASARPEKTQPVKSAQVRGNSEQHYFEVGTADELLAAIGSHRVICLTADIDLSTATDFGTGWGENWRWEHVYDGAELVISAVKDLTITAKRPGLTLTTNPRYASVLTFRDCRDLELEGLTVGHNEIPDSSCAGAVLTLDRCYDAEIEDCALFGCGTVGIEAYNCTYMEVEDTEIYSCTTRGVSLCDVEGAQFENCSIHDCPTPGFWIDEGCYDISWNDTPLYPGEYLF